MIGSDYQRVYPTNLAQAPPNPQNAAWNQVPNPTETSNPLGSALDKQAQMRDIEIGKSQTMESLVHRQPLTLAWQDLCYTVNTKNGPKKILNNLNGIVKPGEMLAIMGPSGGGKTSLLDALAGRLDGSKKGRTLSGQVTLNGKVPDRFFKNNVSYVQQEYSLQTPFTVRQTLSFAADLLLDNSKYNKAARRKAAEDTITVLGLNSAADTIVGDVFRKGLSGGQLRRLSIAVELVGSPGALLLDEPTSGLDSAAAENVMKHLGELASAGRTIVTTIHQPPTDVWERFDKFCLLAEGKCLYFGPAQGAIAYFSQLGHQCPQFANPADYFLRIANTDFAQESAINLEDLASKFSQSPNGQSVKQDIANNPVTTVTQSKRNGWLTQFSVLSGRAFMNNALNPGIFLVRLIMYTGLAFLIGFMYWDLGNSHGAEDVVSRVALLFYVAAFMVFMSIAVLPFFVFERGVFLRERANGWYSVFAYVPALWAMSMPGIALISIVSTLLIVLPSGLNNFGTFFLCLFLSLCGAEAYMAVVAALVPHYIIGIAVGAATYGFFMLCEGFMIIKSDIPDYFIWGHYIGFHTYSFRPFMVNEFEPIKTFDSPQFPSGRGVLAFYEMDPDDYPIWKDLVVLVGYTVLLQIIFSLILHFKHTGKR